MIAVGNSTCIVPGRVAAGAGSVAVIMALLIELHDDVELVGAGRDAESNVDDTSTVFCLHLSFVVQPALPATQSRDDDDRGAH